MILRKWITENHAAVVMGDKMYWIWIMIFLCICTFTDIKKRNVCGWLCILNIVAAIMLHTIFRDISGKSLIEGAIIGGIFLIISVVTREKIGYGDSLVFLTIGLIMGGEKCFVIILWSFLLCSIFSLVAIILKKTTFKSTVAFMPFVLAGALVTFISTQ